MAEEWNEYIASDCDVVVSLVRRSTDISTFASTDQGSPSKIVDVCASASTDQGSPSKIVDVCASASTDQGSLAMDVRNARKRKSLSNPEEEEQNLGDLEQNLDRLRRCSKYFDTCLGERWVGTKIITSQTPVHLTMDALTDVKYYKDCFSRMSFNKYKGIPDVKYCLKLLQVASQISYFELMEDCVCYLASIQWSYEDEKRIRNFANSTFYPSDCALDLSARLGLSLSNTERHVLLLDNTVDALCICFDDFMFYGFQEDLACCQELFSSGFRVLISRPCQSFAENVLKHVNDGVKKIIRRARGLPALKAKQAFENVRWILKLLLETRSATRLVEYIVDESPLFAVLMMLKFDFLMNDWVDSIHSVFKEVIKGRLLLKASTRDRLYVDWTWILVHQNSEIEDDLEREPYKTLSTFIMTFPSEIQKKIILAWMAYERGSVVDEYDQHFVKIHAKWFASLLEKISLLNQPHMDMQALNV